MEWWRLGLLEGWERRRGDLEDVLGAETKIR